MHALLSPTHDGQWPAGLDFDATSRLLLALDLADVRALVHTRFPYAPVPHFTGRLVRVGAERPDVLELELANLRRIVVDRRMFRGAGRTSLEGVDALVLVLAATVVHVL